MTEAIKQWIADEAQSNSGWTGLLSDNSRGIYYSGLTKGIEIAEGFAEWKEDNLWWFDCGSRTWLQGSDHDSEITTSQLLEKYIKTLTQ